MSDLSEKLTGEIGRVLQERTNPSVMQSQALFGLVLMGNQAQAALGDHVPPTLHAEDTTLPGKPELTLNNPAMAEGKTPAELFGLLTAQACDATFIGFATEPNLAPGQVAIKLGDVNHSPGYLILEATPSLCEEALHTAAICATQFAFMVPPTPAHPDLLPYEGKSVELTNPDQYITDHGQFVDLLSGKTLSGLEAINPQKAQHSENVARGMGAATVEIYERTGTPLTDRELRLVVQGAIVHDAGLLYNRSLLHTPLGGALEGQSVYDMLEPVAAALKEAHGLSETTEQITTALAYQAISDAPGALFAAATELSEEHKATVTKARKFFKNTKVHNNQHLSSGFLAGGELAAMASHHNAHDPNVDLSFFQTLYTIVDRWEAGMGDASTHAETLLGVIHPKSWDAVDQQYLHYMLQPGPNNTPSVFEVMYEALEKPRFSSPPKGETDEKRVNETLTDEMRAEISTALENNGTAPGDSGPGKTFWKQLWNWTDFREKGNPERLASAPSLLALVHADTKPELAHSDEKMKAEIMETCIRSIGPPPYCGLTARPCYPLPPDGEPINLHERVSVHAQPQLIDKHCEESYLGLLNAQRVMQPLGV